MEQPANCLNYALPVVLADLQLPASCLSPVALELPTGLSVPAWVGLHQALATVQTAAAWWLGDWCLYGMLNYGEEAEQGLHELGSAWRTHAWVSQKIPPERRRLELSWSHHREIAGLDPTQGDLLLDTADREHWTVARLREAVREYQGKRVHRRADPQGAFHYSAAHVGQQWTRAAHQELCLYLGLDHTEEADA